jgi:PKD repeat protein
MLVKRTFVVKTGTARVFLGYLAFLLACNIAAVTSAQTLTLRIVNYNIEDDIDGATTPLPGLIAPSSGGSVTNGGVLEGIGEENVAGDPAQPIDILALEETTSNTTTVQPIVNGLNIFYSTRNIYAGYAMSTYQATEEGGDTADGNGPNALVYNTNTVQLIASVPVDPAGGTSKLGSKSGEYREVMRYEFAPAGVTPTATNEFYIYVSHYKSSASGIEATNEFYRAEEAAIIRNDEANQLPANSRVLYVGDYNISSSSEASYQTIVSNKAPNGVQQGQGIDALNTSGARGDNWTLVQLTESATSLGWRDDLQVMTTNVYYAIPGGLAYVSGTYHAFGNNGSGYNVGSGNTALDTNLTTTGTGITASQLYQYLTTASDHLPVVADYTIPVPLIVANFSADQTAGWVPLTVTFTDSSTGVITNRFWDFGDSTSTNVTTNVVTHTYGSGTFTVSLVVSGLGGVSTNTQINYITANYIPPSASFTGSPTNGTEPLVVTFSDTSTGTITNRFWDFGDNVTTNTTTNTMVHTYVPGTYPVTLIASGYAGVSTNTKPNYITVLRAPSTITIDAGYLYDRFGTLMPVSGVVVLVADTGNNGFVDPQPDFPLNLGATWGTDDRIVGIWDPNGCGCGDGSLFSQTIVGYTNGVAPGQKLQLYWFPSLTLASNTVGATYYGKYTDTNSPPLDGSDPWQMPTSDSSAYLIFWTMAYGGSNPEAAGQATFLATEPLLAIFTANPTSGVEPLAVTFTDTSTGTISNRFWDFGDGGTTNITTNSVAHSYAAGTYPVTLVVSGPDGVNTNTKPSYITALTAFQSWQMQYFGCTNCPQAAADADPLGKGMSNTNQFLVGVNPTNGASSFRITSVRKQNFDVVITWTAGLGRTNVVQSTTGVPGGSYATNNFLDASPWIILPAGSGDFTTNYPDLGGAANTPYRYYRIRLQP